MMRRGSRGFVAALVGIAVGVGTAEARQEDREGTPTNAGEAAGSWKVPEGFRVELFAAEPDVRQPIGMAIDGRGRLWICENETYSEQAVNFDMNRHDRIVILEDADHDGKAEKRKVFWDQAQRLTSVEHGFGGVWALCAPNLLFLPDADGDDVPDGEPVVVLDGFDTAAVRHNIANGLKWGPDGWLYGRHGILATSKVGAPGTPEVKRGAVNTGVWRYHPTRKVFEAVAHGTTNPWGMDWDENGEPFFINTVIGHLWHVLPGAHYERMFGQDLIPDLYELIPQTADHFHWDTAEVWSDIRKIGVSTSTDEAGGGHAHSGLMCYLGGNWPDEYKGGIFTINLHGRRLNHDRPVRKGAGYSATHGKDFGGTTDPWFRAVDLTYGPDGGVYVADWSDVGECHENDAVHRASGRIFKITYGDPETPKNLPIAGLSDKELVGLQAHKNEWYARQARRVLQERAAAGRPMGAVHEALRERFEKGETTAHRLRALWCLYATGGAPEPMLIGLLGDPDEHVRAWGVRLLADGENVPAAAIGKFTELARKDESGLVLLYLASALQKTEAAERWTIAGALAARAEFAEDPVLPRMVWYGVEGAVKDNPAKAARLAAGARMPAVSRSLARRLTQGLADRPEGADGLVAALAGTPGARKPALEGMVEALRGFRRTAAPEGWAAAREGFATDQDPAVGSLARRVAVVFGDPVALEELREVATDGNRPAAERREAIGTLVDARAEEAVPVLEGLLADEGLSAEAVRGLAAYGRPGTPGLLIGKFGELPAAGQGEAIAALASGPEGAALLLETIGSGAIPRERVPVFQVRQMLALGGEVGEKAAATWPEMRTVSGTAADRIAEWKARLTPSELSRADLSAGRGLFKQTCASCHVLFGEGAKIGPELTGSQRSSLDYLLENLADPSATVGADFRMSVVALADGRVLNGVVAGRTDQSLTLQTPTERLVIPMGEVEEVRQTTLSLMPEGQLDLLKPEQVRDLVGYLMSPTQVPEK